MKTKLVSSAELMENLLKYLKSLPEVPPKISLDLCEVEEDLPEEEDGQN